MTGVGHGKSMPGRAVRNVRLQGVHLRALEMARNRVLVTGVLFALAFFVVAVRLVDLATVGGGGEKQIARAADPVSERGDIVDRHGVLLATSLPAALLFADPSEIIDPVDAADRLVEALPDLDHETLVAKLSGSGRFARIRRTLTPDEQYRVHRLGIPGIAFEESEWRVYPQGRAAAHVVGYTDVDGNGIAGVEKQFDSQLSAGERVQLAVDLRIQNLLRTELLGSMREFRAIGAAGIVLDVNTGEVVAAVSLPDFDPNAPARENDEGRFNRVTKGVYEMGSTFKLFTVATALDTGTTSIDGGYDASKPLKMARYTISDYHAENRWLSVPEILIHSSNIGAALMALDVGTPLQRAYFDGLGLFRAPSIELPEIGSPLIPVKWREINTVTAAFGHGVAVSPLQLVSAVGALVNGGVLRPATILKREPGDGPKGQRVLAERTSKQMRDLMRLVVRYGTGKNADVPGYGIGGKTGTAEKLVGGRYRRDARISSFVGAFPIERPRYVIFAAVDEPKGTARTFNFATGGWVAAPIVGRVVEAMAPMVGVLPTPEQPMSPPQRRPDGLRQANFVTTVMQAIDETRGPLAPN